MSCSCSQKKKLKGKKLREKNKFFESTFFINFLLSLLLTIELKMSFFFGCSYSFVTIFSSYSCFSSFLFIFPYFLFIFPLFFFYFPFFLTPPRIYFTTYFCLTFFFGGNKMKNFDWNIDEIFI